MSNNRKNKCAGTTLIELMVATLILIIVMISAAQWFSTPPVMRSVCRQAAIIKAHGILKHARAGNMTGGAYYAYVESNAVFIPTNLPPESGLSVNAGSPRIPYLVTTNQCVFTNHNGLAVTGILVLMELYDDDKALSNNPSFASFVTLAPP